MPARRYPDELRERAVRMVFEIDDRCAVRRVAEQLGISNQTLRNWVRQAEIDADAWRAAKRRAQAPEVA